MSEEFDRLPRVCYNTLLPIHIFPDIHMVLIAWLWQSDGAWHQVTIIMLLYYCKKATTPNSLEYYMIKWKSNILFLRIKYQSRIKSRMRIKINFLRIKWQSRYKEKENKQEATIINNLLFILHSKLSWFMYCTKTSLNNNYWIRQ